LQDFADFVVFCLKMSRNRLGKRNCLERLGNGALGSGMPCHVMPSPPSGTDTDELVECARERRLVVKSRFNRDLNQRHTGLAHQLFGVLNAVLKQPLMSRDAERCFE
jgi:hypothetical protein